MNTTTIALPLVLVLLAPACATKRQRASFREEGPVPPLLASTNTSTVPIEQVTGKALPESDEYAPTVIDDTDVAFVSNELYNLDIRALNYRAPTQNAIKELVATESNEKAPFVTPADAAGGGKCYFITDSGPSCQVFSGTLPKVRSQMREVLGQRHANWPHISKDKTKMLFSALGPRGKYDVWMRDLVSGGESRITEGQRARWSPTNPDEFVFTRCDKGVWSICKYFFSTGQSQALNPSAFDKFDPEYSPDGQWISFTSNEQGSSDIWVMRADGSEPRSLDPHGAIDCQAVWTPDGRSLLFVTRREGSFDICRLELPEFVTAVPPAAQPVAGAGANDPVPAGTGR